MSKVGPLGRAATYKDLCEVPDHLIAEILEGDLWVSPRPAPRHQHTAAMLTAEIVPPFQHGNGGPGGWWLLYSPRFISPAISWYRILLDGGAIGCRRSVTRRT